MHNEIVLLQQYSLTSLNPKGKVSRFQILESMAIKKTYPMVMEFENLNFTMVNWNPTSVRVLPKYNRGR